jgi:hypothetical protein
VTSRTEILPAFSRWFAIGTGSGIFLAERTLGH